MVCAVTCVSTETNYVNSWLVILKTRVGWATKCLHKLFLYLNFFIPNGHVVLAVKL